MRSSEEIREMMDELLKIRGEDSYAALVEALLREERERVKNGVSGRDLQGVLNFLRSSLASAPAPAPSQKAKKAPRSD